MRRRATQSSELITKVNVTPIIDVALVLVIILLVTAPLMSAAELEVNLPQARTNEAENQRNVSITLGVDGALAVDDRMVALGELRAVLTSRLAEEGEDVLVVVRADSSAAHSDVRMILSEARSAGARRLAIATRQKTKVRS